MEAKGRRAIGLVAIAYAAVAVLLFLQTLVLRVVPYDASSFGALVATFRVAFFAADLTIFTACIAVATRHPSAKPFARAGAATSALSIIAGALGLSALSFGAHRTFDSFVAASGAAESWIALGTSGLLLLAVRAAASDSCPEGAPRPRGLGVATACFLVVSVLWALLTLARMASRDLHSVAVAWLVWAVEIGKVGALAACGLLVLRAARAEPAEGDAGATAPYRDREPGLRDDATGAADAAARALAAPDPATIGPLERALDGVRSYRLGFVLRLGAAVILTFPSVFAATSRGMWPVLVLLPAGGAVTALLMLLGLQRQLALPSLRGGKRLLLAMVPLAVAGLVDGLAALVSLGAGLSMTGWRAQDTANLVWSMAYPASALLAWLSTTILAGAMAHTGRALVRETLIRRARGVQALAVVVVTLAPSIVVAAGQGGRGDGAVFVSMALTLVLVVVTIAFFVVQLLAQSELVSTLRERLYRVA